MICSVRWELEGSLCVFLAKEEEKEVDVVIHQVRRFHLLGFLEKQEFGANSCV